VTLTAGPDGLLGTDVIAENGNVGGSSLDSDIDIMLVDLVNDGNCNENSDEGGLEIGIALVNTVGRGEFPLSANEILDIFSDSVAGNLLAEVNDILSNVNTHKIRKEK